MSGTGWLALLFGCPLEFAIPPGISRSGTTVVVAMALGMTPLGAAEFWFLLGDVAMAGTAILRLPKLTGADAALMSSIRTCGALMPQAICTRLEIVPPPKRGVAYLIGRFA